MESLNSPIRLIIPRPGSPHRIIVDRDGFLEVEPGEHTVGHQDQFVRSFTAGTHNISKNSDSTDYEQIRSAMSRVQSPSKFFNSTFGGTGKYIVNGEEEMVDSGLESSSNTVLLALKSLQEKIQRLESEKHGALKECDLLRKQNVTDRKEMERSAELQAVEALNRDTATRLAHERLSADKAALQIKLMRVQEQNSTISHELDEIRVSAELETRKRRQAEEEKIRSMHRRVNSLELDSAMKALQCRIIDMESELAIERSMRKEAESRLSGLKDAKSQVDEFLKSILYANEAAISQIYCPSPPLHARREANVLQVAKLDKPESSRQGTMTSQNRMKNTNKKRREGLPSYGRSSNAMYRRSNNVTAVAPKSRGTFERGEDTSRSSAPCRRVQSANDSPSRLHPNRPFLPPGIDKDSFNTLATVRKDVVETRRSGPGPGEEEDNTLTAMVERWMGSVDNVPHLFGPMN